MAITPRQQPDIIVCNIDVPKLYGYGVARELKSDPTLGRTPFIAVTALATVGDREKVLGAEIDGYIGEAINLTRFVRESETFPV